MQYSLNLNVYCSDDTEKNQKEYRIYPSSKSTNEIMNKHFS